MGCEQLVDALHEAVIVFRKKVEAIIGDEFSNVLREPKKRVMDDGQKHAGLALKGFARLKGGGLVADASQLLLQLFEVVANISSCHGGFFFLKLP